MRPEKIKGSLLASLLGHHSKWRPLALTLSITVVFVTTYILILPAVTLDKQSAQKQGGIELAADPVAEEQAEPSDKGGAEAGEVSAESPVDAGTDADAPAAKTAGPDEPQAAEENSGSSGKDASVKSEEAEDAAKTLSGTLSFSGDGYDITATCSEKAGLPLDTELTAEEIAPKSDDYESYYQKALSAVQKKDGKSRTSDFEFAKFYDISLMADGENIEPASGIDVEISYDKALPVSDADQIRIVHFAVDEKTGKVAAEVLDDDLVTPSVKKNKMTAAEFEADSFSVYAVVYTVDFHYEANGKKFDFSMPGGGYLSFRDLAEKLGIAADDADTEADELQAFVDDVSRIEFSDPELVSISKEETDTTVGAIKERLGLECEYSADLTKEQIKEINAQEVRATDWALISLKPFTSEETLTVTMENGDTWTVKVTDAQKAYKDVSTLETGTYIIYRPDNSSSRFMYLKNDGTTKTLYPETGQALTANDLSNYTWTVTRNGDGTFTIKSTNGNRYINLYGDNLEYNKWSNNSRTSVNLSGNDGIAIAHNGKVLKRNDNGFYNATGTGVGLTFYKIEDDPSGGSTETPGIVLSDAEREWLENWKDTLTAFNTLTDYDKKAEVFNEDQRIYQIDINASSGVTDFYKDVDLGFVLDISNSMQFPSSLKALEDQSGNEYQVWMNASALNAARSAYSEYYNKQNCFYIISDPALTSTIYRVFWDGSAWRYQDASELGNNNIYYVNDGTVFKEPYRQPYTLYYADDTTRRFKYLQDSVTYAINTLKKIVKPTDVVDDETSSVRVAYNLFASQIYESDSFKDLRDNENRLFAIPLEYTKSGTRQDLALYDGNFNPSYPWTIDTSDELSANEFGWDTGSDQYVILVTDGAPNGASMNDVRTAAQNLKTQYPNVKIFTIGLSTKDVDGGSQMLYDIADDVGGMRQFYEAEKAQDLEYILLKILRTIMAEGLVRGTVSDTIDKGFYPVDAQGNPLSAGVYKNGTRIQNAQISDYVSGGKPTAAHQNEVFYTWEQIGDEWKITWYNQEIGWDDNDSTTGNPWTGTVYVKAKEDYLGGNLIETNDGNAQIEPTGIKLIINGTPESNWRPLEDMSKIDLPIPRVNVHNLETKENSTTWTVYKGTSVTPKEQLEALWDAIPIEEVVSSSENGQHKRTTGAAANVGTAGNGETFTLGSLMAEVAPDFNIDSLIDQITSTKNSASTSFEYAAYGHKSGTITVKVERTVGNKTPAEHTADTVGSPVEQYKVTFTYQPYAENQRHSLISEGWSEAEQQDFEKNGYHNGPNGRGTEETGEIKSENTHTINVYVKGMQITKVDLDDQILTGAKFALYRTARAGETSNLITIDDDQYYKIADLDTSATGVATKDQIERLNDGEQYYLVETQVPAGYDAIEPIPVNLIFSDTYVPKPGDTAQSTRPDSGMYDWTQSTALVLDAEYGVKRTDADNTTDLTNSGTASSVNETVYYRIINNPGVELPQSGGPGTTAFYLLGILLSLISGILLIARRRTAKTF